MNIDEKYLSGCDEYLALHMWQSDSGLTYNAHLECTYGTKYKNIYLDDILIPKFQNLYNHARDHLLCSSTQSIESIQDWYQWDSIASVLWSYKECKASSFENDRLKPFYSQQVDINRGYSLVSSMRKALDLIIQDQLYIDSVGKFVKKIDEQKMYKKYFSFLKFLYLVNNLANANKHSLTLQLYNPWTRTEIVRIFSVDKYNINSLLRALASQAEAQGVINFSLIVEYNIHINQLIISFLEFIFLLLNEENFTFILEKE